MNITTDPAGTATVEIPSGLTDRAARLTADQALAEARGLTTDELENYWTHTDSTETTLTYTWIADDFGPAL